MDKQYLKIGLFALCLVVAAGLFVVFFEQFPIEGTSLAIDWKGLWLAVENGQLRYVSSLGFRIPPWDALLVLPLGFFSMRASWGLIVLITMLVLIASVPRTERRWLYWLSVALLTLSFPSLRHSADGNFEALVIAGVLLTVIGYQRQNPYLLAGGILLAVAKPQEAVLLMAVLAVYLLQTFPRPMLLKTVGAVALVVVPTMLWRGGDWLSAMLGIAQRGSIMDVSLMAALNRTELLPSPVVIVLWAVFIAATLVICWKSDRTLSREKAAMLVAASLLISPYAAGNSVLTVLAVGVIPLFYERRWLGALLIALVNLPILANDASGVAWQAYYWTAYLLLCWGIFGWRALRGSAAEQSTPAELKLST